MDLISDQDVVRLSNAVVLKCNLGININEASQCTSDFILVLYHAIMGEFPAGVLTDCTTTESQEHNITCVVDTLSNDYLHVDLSHISPSCFVEGDPATVYNLLEILDGLLEFMLDQISSNADSGDEADVDSDQFSVQSNLLKQQNLESDTSVCTADLINYDVTPHKFSEVEEGEQFVPLPRSFSPASSKDEWEELRPSLNEITEHTLNSTDLSRNAVVSDRTESLINLDDDIEPRPMLIESLKHPADAGSTQRILNDLTNSLSKSLGLGSTYKIPDKPEPDVILDTSVKGSGMSVSDVTSERSHDGSVKSTSVILEDKEQLSEEDNQTPTSQISEGLDVADGIPRPTLGDQNSRNNALRSTYTTNGSYVPERQHGESDSGILPPNRDWEALLENLQKTVEESKKVRKKYFVTPHKDGSTTVDDTGESVNETEQAHVDSTGSSTDALGESYGESLRMKQKQKNVRFEDTVSTQTAEELKNFKDVLRKEKELQDIKNQVLSSSYRDHLDEVEEVERRKIKPLVDRADSTERFLRGAIIQQQKRAQRSQLGKQSSMKKDLAAAAKWKSWQTTNVQKTPNSRMRPIKKKIQGNMVIGEHDLLPALIAEFPGLELSSTALNNAWRKQFQQIERLTRSESNHMRQKRNNEKQLQEAHHKHELLTEIMRREHEHNQRVRDSKDRASNKREAQRNMKDRRQQSARVRRYYRDYQLQMRSRMLKRRTREEKLFKNLFEEGLSIQRSRLNDLRCYARDKRNEQQRRQRDEIESMENYYKDQFAILAETLEKEKTDLRIRDKSQTKLLRQMKSGLREKMEREVRDLQERIVRDDEDIYFREMEADRIRRQLQLATYHAKFHGSLKHDI
ncbi:centrosomal protein of 95 kDa-like [Clavelina lepadiformis]|uniref:centrosomal protein of 95 kDa-like n=1 Tax=Clavelina lepadiformis TaxID=159417 RepID=UPI00404356E4